MQTTIDFEQDIVTGPVKSRRKQCRIERPSVVQPVMSFGDNEEDTGEYGPWIVTKKTDPDCVALADRHYSRVTIGASQFTRPGPNLVMRTQNGDAAWVSWYSKQRDDHFKDVIECSFFRNESPFLSSDLVKWAVYASIQKWGIPEEGFITFVKDDAVKSTNPGANYLHAGFKKVGLTKARKLTILQLQPHDIPEAIAEVRLIHDLISLKNIIDIAMDEGEFMEALEFYKMAKSIEQELRQKKSELARRKGNKWDSFEPNEDPFDFLSSICPDKWIPLEMFELLEEGDYVSIGL